MTTHPILVIGGGPAGLQAARGLAEIGVPSILVEKKAVLGGTPVHSDYAALTPDLRPAEEAMSDMASPLAESRLVDVRLSTVVTRAEGQAPALKVTLEGGGGTEVVTCGAVIIATGFTHFDPGQETQMYGYYSNADVITLVDAERMFKAGEFVRPSNGEKPKQVCFIQCVGSRDRQIGNQWCSKVCCGIACKQSIEIKHLVPDCRVIVFYIDLRAYGFWEDELYWKAQEDHKVAFVKGIVTEITKRGDRLLVKGEDTTMGRPVEVPMDMVILSVGMEPSAGTRKMAEVFDVALEDHGFIGTHGGALDTVSTSRPGVYVAGAAAGPADLEDCVSSAGLAAMKAYAFVRKAESA